MSLEVIATLICDGCGTRLSGSPEHRFGNAKICAQTLRHQVELDGWETVSRGRYNTEGHYCPACKDKPIKPIPRAKRAPRRKLPPIIRGTSHDPTTEGEQWKPKPETGDEWKEP